MAYYLNGHARKIPWGHPRPPNQMTRLLNPPYSCGAALNGLVGDDDTATPSEDEHFQPPIGPGQTAVVSQESRGDEVRVYRKCNPGWPCERCH